jgi:hypothetical protein
VVHDQRANVMIQKLYQNDALGAVDEILVEDSWLGLLNRRRSPI